MIENNPLKQYFRRPAIFINLPSRGEYYPEQTIDMPVNHELPVYPMTAIDEISARTPDALFNGSAVVSIIQSCIPNIKDPWVIPGMDVDTILIAIRLASYGHNMEFLTQCPSCNHSDELTIDLRTVLDSIKTPDYHQVIHHGDMEFYFRPMTYKDMNESNQMQFEEQRMLQMIMSDSTPDDQKIKTLNQALLKVTELTVKAMVLSIAAIKTPSALVTEKEFISDLLKNCDRSLFNSIRDHMLKLKSTAEIQPLQIKCNECSHEYPQSITLDMSSFFGAAS